MQEDLFGRVKEAMDVFDRDGDKVGTIGKVYPRVTATAQAGFQSPAAGTAPTANDFYIKVDTGFLGLGKDLYIPSSMIDSVTTDAVTVNVDKDELDDMGFDRRPDFLPDDD
jgi:hypothetical protein